MMSFDPTRPLTTEQEMALSDEDAVAYQKARTVLAESRPRPTRHPLEMDPEDIAPPPAAPQKQRLVLITDDEWQVIETLEAANDMFMRLPQVDATERSLWSADFRHLYDRILRRAAVRGHSTRQFVGDGT